MFFKVAKNEMHDFFYHGVKKEFVTLSYTAIVLKKQICNDVLYVTNVSYKT
eukprot:UN02778